jgi:hypothetical protein
MVYALGMQLSKRADSICLDILKLNLLAGRLGLNPTGTLAGALRNAKAAILVGGQTVKPKTPA